MSEHPKPEGERGDVRPDQGTEPKETMSPLVPVLWIFIPLVALLVYGIVTSLE